MQTNNNLTIQDNSYTINMMNKANFITNHMLIFIEKYYYIFNNIQYVAIEKDCIVYRINTTVSIDGHTIVNIYDMFKDFFKRIKNYKYTKSYYPNDISIHGNGFKIDLTLYYNKEDK